MSVPRVVLFSDDGCRVSVLKLAPFPFAVCLVLVI